MLKSLKKLFTAMGEGNKITLLLLLFEKKSCIDVEIMRN